MYEKLLNQAYGGDKRAIGRIISLVEANAPGADDIMRSIYPKSGKAHIIGITGSPGAGKSTMVNRLISYFRDTNQKVAVIAVDPSSSFTGGAILGDRLRMQEHSLDPNVFIRSMGTRGSLGGVSHATRECSLILDACGYDAVIIETVGVGQSEIDIVRIAETVCLVLTPGMGDDVQIMKAGIMEIADLFIVNKADKPGADKVGADVQNMLKMLKPKEWQTPVHLVSSLQNSGFEEVINSLINHKVFLTSSEEGADRRRIQVKMELESILREEIAKVVQNSFSDYFNDEVMRNIADRKVDPYSLTTKVIKQLIKQQ